jgi:uncharacterized protein YhfF
VTSNNPTGRASSSDWQAALEAAFPGAEERYFAPMSIGNTRASADRGAELILGGIKTTTSSAHWEYPDGRIPFAGALSVLLDGDGRARAIIETERVEMVPFGEVDEAFAHAYGEGERTLSWWRAEIGASYQQEATRRGESFSDDYPLICEWLKVVWRL